LHIFLAALNAIENEVKRGKLNRSNLPEVFDCFTKITGQFTFMRAGSPIDDFFDSSRADGRVSDQPVVAFDGVTFMVLDKGAIAAGFASKKGAIHLRRVIIWMGALRFVHAIRSHVFSNSSLPSIVIPWTVEIIGSSCFADCESLSSVSIESDSLLRRIEPSAFSESSFSSIVIPRTVEILGSDCFSSCKSLSSVLMESGSLLRRIDSYAFYRSSLMSIVIPRNVEIIGSSCVSYCKSLSSVLIESGSLLQRIEPSAFSNSSLPSIVIPRTVEILGPSCFHYCNSLSSVSIDSDS
jgi:hypothetical protein